MGVSEVAQLKQQIVDEYLAAKMGLLGLAYGTSRHQFITAKMERLGESFVQLTQIVGSPQAAMQILADTLKDLPEQATRYQVVDILRYELGENEETAILLDWIQDAWKTHDRLIERFGEDTAWKILRAPSSLASDEEQPS